MSKITSEGENLDHIYRRSVSDMTDIIKHAKLNEKNLTNTSQALYYPSTNIPIDRFKLMELDEHLLKQIEEGQTLLFKGGFKEKVVLCTDEKTYEVKSAEISNSLLVVPGLKIAVATSVSPLKNPRTGNNSLDDDLNESNEEDLGLHRELEHRNVLKVFHEYFECNQIQPRFRKLGELLQLTRYSGPENEDFIDRKLLFTFDELLNTVQCSRKQFEIGVRQHHALEYEDYIRVLDCEYEFRIVNLMVGLISENSWLLDEIDRTETVAALEGICPQQIVEGLFDLYTSPLADNEYKYTYNEELVARIVARNILQPGLKFRIEEFMSTWQDALPDGMKCEEKYLRGLGIFDKGTNLPCIRSLVEQNLPKNIHDRLTALFRTKTLWTLDEMEPYMESFTSPKVSISALLAKYARSLTENGKRYYVSKH